MSVAVDGSVVVAEPAFGHEPEQQGDGEDRHPRDHESRLIDDIAVAPHCDPDQRQREPREQESLHSGGSLRWVKRRTPALKSSVARASTLVTTPAAMPSSNDSESS